MFGTQAALKVLIISSPEVIVGVKVYEAPVKCVVTIIKAINHMFVYTALIMNY